MSLTVLMNAGPWLSVPPPGYGGIENVIATLVPELRRLGVRVVLASVGDSTLPVDELVSVFPEGQFASLQRPYNQVCGVAQAHLAGVVRELHTRDDIDLVHDHVEAVGLATLTAMGADAPPVLHTLHWDLAKHPALYGTLDGGGRVRVNGVSASQLARAPQALRDHSVGHVHLSTPSPWTPTAGPGPARATTWWCSAGSTRARARTSAPGSPTGSASGWSSPAPSARTTGRRTSPPPARRPARTPTSASSSRRSRRTWTGTWCAGSGRSPDGSATTCWPPPGWRCSRCAGRSPVARPWSSRWPWAPRWWESPGAACPSWSRTAAPACSPPTRRSWASWCSRRASSTRTSAAARRSPGSPRR